MHKKPWFKAALGLVLTLALSVGLATACSGGTVTVTAGNVSSNQDLLVYGDMVTNVGCLNTSVGHRGELLVWRIRVVDPNTGADMTDEDISSVTATLPTGEEFNLTYGGHPGGGSPTDWFWSAPWEIPLNFPTGSLGYEIDAVANDGRTGNFSPFEVSSSKLSIKEYDPAFVAGKSTNITATGFSTTNIVASQGAKVTFNNKDTVAHTIVGDGWTSGEIAPGKNFARVFDTPGTYSFHDQANPGLSGTVVVNAA